ncbi:MAG: tetratricopeptide repeat protein, partial [Opitutae bacterium]|nr:tetratricopeptide repeat protein [Opitutae bacterium]
MHLPLQMNLYRLLIAYFLISLFSSVGYSATTVDGSLAGRIARLTTLLHSNQLVAARPLIAQVRGEVPPEMVPNLDFYLALSYVFEYYENNNSAVLTTAATQFESFIKTYPNHSLSALARYNLADVHAINQKFKEALQLYVPLYRQPVASVDRKEVLGKLVLIYAATQEWAAGAPYFRDSMRIAESSEDRTTSAAYLLIAQAKSGEVVDSSKLLEFFKSPAPVFYTPRFNAALMEVGDNLKEEDDLPTASLFYQFVRDYETLETGLTAYIRTLERRVAKFEDNVVLRNFYVEAKAKLENANADLAALRSSTNYTPLLHWRIAGVYMDMERKWEAFWRFRLMVDAYPDHKYAEEILFSAYSLSHQLGANAIAEELGKRYLDNGTYTSYRDTVADQVSGIYLEEEKYDELYELTAWYLERAADDTAAQLLLFKHAVARLTKFENPELIRDFQIYREKYGNSKCAVVIHYFLGLSYLIEQENASAVEFFDKVIVDPNPKFRADASFRKAQAVLGLDRIEESRDLIEQFIAKYPSHQLRAEAELTLGNVVDMLGEVDNALRHYYLVEQHTEDRHLLAKAELKISRILIDRRQFDEAVARLEAFIEAHGDYAESIPISAALATIYTDEDQPRVALGVLKQPLDKFFEQTEIHQLDKLLIDSLKLDRNLRTMQRATDEFLNLVKADPALLDELINDRAKQYRYFKENDSIDALVQECFVHDNEFRKAVQQAISTFEEQQSRIDTHNKNIPPESNSEPLENAVLDVTKLDALQDQVEALNQNIPAETADDFLAEALAVATAQTNMPLVVRIKTALAKVEEPVLPPDAELLQLWDDAEQWTQLGTAGQLWILGEHAKTNPQRVAEVLEATYLDFLNTPNELGLHLLQAQCFQDLDRIDESIEAYRMLIKRFAQAKESGDAAMQIGQMEVGRKNAATARLELESILHRNDWRGAMHAQA